MYAGSEDMLDTLVEEIHSGFLKLKTRQSGKNYITSEMLKLCNEQTLQLITLLHNQCLQDLNVPDD